METIVTNQERIQNLINSGETVFLCFVSQSMERLYKGFY